MRRKTIVTVGIPVRNNEKTIDETIKSILNQDYPHELMEIVVVDGLSKDRTLEIIRDNVSKSDIRMKILSDGGGGLGFARQLIVENAEGEFVSWVDGDIVIPGNYVRAQVEFLKQHPDVGAIQGTKCNYEGTNIVDSLEIMSNLHYALKRQRDTLATRAALYRLKAIRDAGGFDKNIKGAGEDVDLSIRMHKRGWLLLMNNGEWVHIGRGGTWKGLWDQFWWYGYGMHLVSHKHEGSILLWQWTPPASLVAGLRRSIGTYKMTGKTTSFLLPLYFMFKNLAWILGYAKSNLDDYGHGTMTRQLSKTPTS